MYLSGMKLRDQGTLPAALFYLANFMWLTTRQTSAVIPILSDYAMKLISDRP